MSISSTLNEYLSVPAGRSDTPELRFEMQPIMQISTGRPQAYELLFRGAHLSAWRHVDRGLIRHLAAEQLSPLPLFVNVSNDAILEIPEGDFVAAARNNDITIEISESAIDDKMFGQVTEKINSLSSRGLRFAIDDFGSGQDGLKRLYAFNSITVVKIDGAFMRTSKLRRDAAAALRSLIGQWKANNILAVAECIEDEEMLLFARDIGVDLVQGWHIDAVIERLVSTTIS